MHANGLNNYGRKRTLLDQSSFGIAETRIKKANAKESAGKKGRGGAPEFRERR